MEPKPHRPTPAAIYARYSTDKQDARSTEDQIRRCRRFAEAHGYTVSAAHIYEDKAISGASAARAELQRMLLHARRHGGTPFTAVLVDDQSRLARDLGTAWRLIFEELPPLGVKVVDCTTGRASDETGARLTFGVTALMNDAFLEMVRTETHRGMEGRALAGFATGGRTFGYDTRKEVKPTDPEHPRSEIGINEDEAKLVRRIFDMWIAGGSYKSIAFTLNDEAIPAPHDRGNGNKGVRGWVPGTIRAMLMNDRYIGRLTWNKTKWIKDRTTGKRRQIDNPREEWTIVDRPDLRIVDDHIFVAAQARFRERPAGPGRPAGTHTKRPSLCAGLLRCGKCEGSMTIVGQSHKANGSVYRQYGCTAHYTRGAKICPNALTVSETKASEEVISEVRRVLAKPGAADDLAALYAHRAAAAEKAAEAHDGEKRVAAAEKKVRNLFAAIAQLGLTDGLSAAIKEAERERDAAKAQARRESRSGQLLAHPARVEGAIREILSTLQLDPQRANALLRKHVGRFVLKPTEEGYEFEGRLQLLPEEEEDLGFLESPALAEEAGAGVSGNSGSGGRLCPTFVIAGCTVM